MNYAIFLVSFYLQRSNVFLFLIIVLVPVYQYIFRTVRYEHELRTRFIRLFSINTSINRTLSLYLQLSSKPSTSSN